MPGENDISIGISVSGAEQVIAELNRIQEAFKSFEKLGGSFQGITSAIDSLRTLQSSFTNFSTSINSAVTAVNSLTTALSNAARQASTLNTAASNIKSAFPAQGMGAGVATAQHAAQAQAQVAGLAPVLIRQQQQISNQQQQQQQQQKQQAAHGGVPRSGGWGEFLMAPAFMLRYKAMSAILGGLEYAAVDIGMGRSRAKLANAARDLTAIGFDRGDRNYAEQRAVQLSSRLTGFSTADYMKTMSELGSSLDVKDVGVGTLATGTDATMVMALRSKMGFEQAGKLVASVQAALKGTKAYKNLSEGEAFQSIATSLMAGIQHTQAWGGDYRDVFAHSLPLVKEFGWDLNTALGFSGTMKSMGAKAGPIGRFMNTLLTDPGMDQLTKVWMAGGADDFGMLERWNPRAQQFFKEKGIKKGDIATLKQLFRHEAIPTFRELLAADPAGFMGQLSERYQKALSTGHLRSDMFKDRQWSKFFSMMLDPDFILKFKTDVEKIRATAEGGPQAAADALAKEHATEPGMAYTRLLQAGQVFSEAMSKAGPFANSLNRFADALFTSARQSMALYNLDTAQTMPFGRRQISEFMDEEKRKPWFSPSVLGRTSAGMWNSLFRGIHPSLGLTDQEWDSEMQKKTLNYLKTGGDKEWGSQSWYDLYGGASSVLESGRRAGAFVLDKVNSVGRWFGDVTGAKRPESLTPDNWIDIEGMVTSDFIPNGIGGGVVRPPMTVGERLSKEYGGYDYPNIQLPDRFIGQNFGFMPGMYGGPLFQDIESLLPTTKLDKMDAGGDSVAAKFGGSVDSFSSAVGGFSAAVASIGASAASFSAGANAFQRASRPA